MVAIVYGLVAVALIVGFFRIVSELRTGQIFGWEGKTIAMREHNPILYWSVMILEALAAVLVTSVFVTNCLKGFGRR